MSETDSDGPTGRRFSGALSVLRRFLDAPAWRPLRSAVARLLQAPALSRPRAAMSTFRELLDTPRGRRFGGAALVVCGLLIAMLVLWPGGNDNEKAAPENRRLLIVDAKGLGIAFAYPNTWSRSVVNGVIRLRSPDRSALLTFATPLGPGQRARVKYALRQALSKRFAPAKVVRDRPGKLGGRPAATFELVGGSGADKVRALALVASTPYRTYAVTLLGPARPSTQRVEEVQGILSTVRLSKPRTAKR